MKRLSMAASIWQGLWAQERMAREQREQGLPGCIICGAYPVVYKERCSGCSTMLRMKDEQAIREGKDQP